MVNIQSLKTEPQAQFQLFKLLDILTRYGADITKQYLWDITPTSYRVQIPSLVKFHQEQMKKKQISIQNIPSSLLIEFVTLTKFVQNENWACTHLDPTDIASLFIEILVLLDFYNRHTTKIQQYNVDQKDISPWLETRLCLHIFLIYFSYIKLLFIVLLSHSLVVRLKYFMQNRYQKDQMFVLTIINLTPENCNVMNAVTLIEEMLMKCNQHINQKVNEKLRSFIASIKERIKQGEIIQIRENIWWQTIGKEEQFNEIQINSENNNRRVELYLKEHNEIIFGLVDHCEKEKIERISESTENFSQIPNDIQKLATSSFESDHIQSQIMNNTTIFSQIFQIDSEFWFIIPINFLDERNQSQTQQLELQSNNESMFENEQVVYALRRILMKQKERSQQEQEEFEWACEASIPLLVLVLKQYIDRFNKSKILQMRQYEKDALLILAHIVMKGVININYEYGIFEKQYNIFQGQFELTGFAAIIEMIVIIHKSKVSQNWNLNKEIISESQDSMNMKELETQINILHLYMKSIQNNNNWMKQQHQQIYNDIDFEEEEIIERNDYIKSKLMKIIQYLKFFISYYNQQQIISNQIILNNKSEDKEQNIFIFARICVSLLNDFFINYKNSFNNSIQSEKLKIFNTLTQILHFSTQKSDSCLLFQTNAIKCLSILLNNNSHLASLQDLRNFINIINNNISEAISTPHNFILAHRAINSFHLLVSINQYNHQNQQFILDYNYGSSLTLLTQRSRTSLINSSTSEAIRKLCKGIFQETSILFRNNGYWKLFFQCKFGQILSLWMCSAGGEEQRDDIIIETMNQLQQYDRSYVNQYNIDKEDRLIDQTELQKNALLMRKELEEQMKEEGIEEECEANIHSSQDKLNQIADQLKREMKQYQYQYPMW